MCNGAETNSSDMFTTVLRSADRQRRRPICGDALPPSGQGELSSALVLGFNSLVDTHSQHMANL